MNSEQKIKDFFEPADSIPKQGKKNYFCKL